MGILKISTMAQQVADHLRGELERGRWVGLMLGRDRLARELGVNRKTVESALVKLETEGILKSQGPGKRRRIQVPKLPNVNRLLRIGLLFHDKLERDKGYFVDVQHKLAEVGHVVVQVRSSLMDLGMDPKRVARVVGRADADAWIVVAGSSEVLEWFARSKKPVCAVFGRRRELLIAGVGPDKPPAYAAAARDLIQRDHRRIVLFCSPERRIPEPGASERAFLAELAAHGIPVSRFQLPAWDGSIESFHQRLDRLFRVTPPTAMILDGMQLFAGARSFLADRGLRVPEDVSLVCTDYEPWFDWCRPKVAHIRWDTRPVVNRIVGWAKNLSCGRRDIRQVEIPAEYVPGGTIGRAP